MTTHDSLTAASSLIWLHINVTFILVHIARSVSMAAESSTQDSRKRTLEALERRFAVAKAELLTQQKKSKTSVKGDGKHHTASYASTDSSLLSPGPSDMPSLSTSSKRGNSTFSFRVFLFTMFRIFLLNILNIILVRTLWLCYVSLTLFRVKHLNLVEFPSSS